MPAPSRFPGGIAVAPKELPSGQIPSLWDRTRWNVNHYDWEVGTCPMIATTVTGTAGFVLGSVGWYYVSVTTAGTAIVTANPTGSASNLRILTGTTPNDTTVVAAATSAATPAFNSACGTLLSTRDWFFAANLSLPATTTGIAAVGFFSAIPTVASTAVGGASDGVWLLCSGTTLTLLTNGQGATGAVTLGTWTGAASTQYDVEVYYRAATRACTAAYRARTIVTGAVSTNWTVLPGATLTTTQVANWTAQTTPVGPAVLASTTTAGSTAYNLNTDYMTIAMPRG